MNIQFLHICKFTYLSIKKQWPLAFIKGLTILVPIGSLCYIWINVDKGNYPNNITNPYILYFLCLMTFILVSPMNICREYTRKIERSELGALILRPTSIIHYFLNFWLTKSTLLLPVLIPIFAAIALKQWFYGSFAIQNWFFGIVTICTGLLLRFTLLHCIATVYIFWKSYWILFLIEELLLYIFGGLIPLQMSYEFIQKISIFIPSSFMLGYPAEMLAFGNSKIDFSQLIITQLFLAMLFWFSSEHIIKMALKKGKIS